MSTSTTSSLTAVAAGKITGGFYWGDDSDAATKKFPALDYVTATAFTPAITFGGAAVGLTYTSRSGIYVKVGVLVFFKLDILLSAKGSSTGNAAVTGLPFTCAADGNCSASIGYASALSSVAGHLGAIVNNGASTIELTQTGTGTIADLTNANFSNSSRLMISGFFNV